MKTNLLQHRHILALRDVLIRLPADVSHKQYDSFVEAVLILTKGPINDPAIPIIQWYATFHRLINLCNGNAAYDLCKKCYEQLVSIPAPSVESEITSKFIYFRYLASIGKSRIVFRYLKAYKRDLHERGLLKLKFFQENLQDLEKQIHALLKTK